MNNLLAIILLTVAFISCSPHINSDNEIPVIENLEIINLDSVPKKEFPSGANVQFSANFIDDQELGSYKFDIHFAGDGHKHINEEDSVAISKKSTKISEWNFTKNGKLNGTEQTLTFKRKIEFKDDKGKILDIEATAGPYHCVVYSVDGAGNASKFIHDKFLVTNEDMPIYTITEPDFTDYKISKDSVMNVKGSVYGSRGLSKLAYIIRSVDDLNVADLVSESELIGGNVKDKTFDTNISFPSEAPSGMYALILLASDKAENVGEYYEIFEITN